MYVSLIFLIFLSSNLRRWQLSKEYGPSKYRSKLVDEEWKFDRIIVFCKNLIFMKIFKNLFNIFQKSLLPSPATNFFKTSNIAKIEIWKMSSNRNFTIICVIVKVLASIPANDLPSRVGNQFSLHLTSLSHKYLHHEYHLVAGSGDKKC